MYETSMASGDNLEHAADVSQVLVVADFLEELDPFEDGVFGGGDTKRAFADLDLLSPAEPGVAVASVAEHDHVQLQSAGHMDDVEHALASDRCLDGLRLHIPIGRRESLAQFVRAPDGNSTTTSMWWVLRYSPEYELVN
jgi:hypothetical protein